MKRKTKKIAALIACLGMVVSIAGCSQARRASWNVSREANRFDVTRRLAVINARTDKPIFEVVGNFGIFNNGVNELEIIVEVEKGKYKKHFIYLNEWTIYTVEDVSGAFVDNYHYEINYLPEMFNPIKIISED